MPHDDDPERTAPKVGHGRPPVHSQFRKGTSGNPKGRPKIARAGPQEVDLAQLGVRVRVRTGSGSATMDVREAVLRRQVEKAVKGDLKAIDLLLSRFAKYGAIAPPSQSQSGGIIVLPSTLPWVLALKAFEALGEPPWDEADLAPLKAAYVATRNEGQKIFDDIMEYDL